MDNYSAIRQAVKTHYEKYVYPQFPLLTSVRKYDTYALNLDSLWARFNGKQLVHGDKKILLAGCGGFSPYPMAVANKRARITALDLSKANLKRARLHTLLHLYFNVEYIEGDLIDAKAILGEKRFNLIDCYGVLHHIPDPVSALQSIHSLLDEGAIVRIMVYSAGARRSIQAVRTAMRILRIDRVKNIECLYKKATKNGRFKDCIDSTYEARFDWGVADMFLHPYAKTYKIDEVLEILDEAQLEPILFIHPGALVDVLEEIARLREMEHAKKLATNFILFAGRIEDSELRLAWNRRKQTQDTLISLNPLIKSSLPLLPLKTLRPAPKFGFENPLIDFKVNRLLSQFRQPVKKSSLTPARWDAIQPYLQAMFLVETST